MTSRSRDRASPEKETTMRLLTILAALLCAAPAWAESLITADHAWARATSASQTVGGAFLTLTAVGAADRLLSASSPAAASVELHETIKDGDVMRMRPVAGLNVTPGRTVELKPGGLHLMLMGLKRPLALGAKFPVTLAFEKSAPVTVIVTVAGAGAGGPVMDHGAMHAHTP